MNYLKHILFSNLEELGKNVDTNHIMALNKITLALINPDSEIVLVAILTYPEILL